MDPDAEVVARARTASQGDLRAFDELVRRHEAHVRANCRFLVGDVEAASDLAQEVFVKAYFALERFEGRSTFGTWLGRIKVNHCLNYRRARRGRDELDVDDLAIRRDPSLRVAPTVERDMERAELAEQVADTLERLPASLRIPLVMRDMDGMTYEEIAGELALGLSAVKMRIARARAAFRRDWQPDGVSP